MPNLDTTNREHSIVLITMSNNKKVTIYSVYQPPRKDLLPDVNNIFSNKKNRIFIGGDLNSKNNRVELKNNEHPLVNDGEKYKYIVTTSKQPTYYVQQKRPDIFESPFYKTSQITSISLQKTPKL